MKLSNSCFARTFRTHSWTIVSLSAALLSAATVAAQQPDPGIGEGKICIGLNPETMKWGELQMDVFHHRVDCARGMALMATALVIGTRQTAAQQRISGWCCPLPDDALLDDRVDVESRCPDGYVATGGHSAGSSQDHNEWAREEKVLHCTKLNPAHYRLGPPTEPAFLQRFGYEVNLKTFTDLIRNRTQIGGTRGTLPASARYGVGRVSESEWKNDFCAGYPWGSLLAEKTDGKKCPFHFRQLLYTGAPGDPPDGTAVRIFADCLAVLDPLSAKPTCLRP